MFVPLADLDRHANERPDSPALTTPGRQWTFAQLKQSVDAAAIRLRAAGVAPRNVVALDLPSAFEWILDLALFRLATRSVSLRGVPDSGSLAFDVLLTGAGGRTGLAPIVLTVDERWFEDAVSEASGAAPLVDYPRSDSVVRLMLTSGTTGTPKAAAYSASALEFRRAGLHRYWTDGRSELNFMALSTTGGLHTAIADLQHGQAHRAVDFINETTMRFASAEGVRVLCGSPVQIAAALRVLADHDIALPALEEVRLAGAAPTATLLRLIDERLRVPVRSVYGSTEGGGVTMRMVHPDDDLSNVGPALPGIDLEVVEGVVRYRGHGLVSGYLAGGTVEPLPKGWFEPGDTGALADDGSLVLGGRSSEVINASGLKVDPARVDELALAFPGVQDAAAFVFERATGVAALGLAVVSTPETDLRALDQALRQQLRAGFPTAYWRIDEIPRNRMGKPERAVIAEAYVRAIAG